MCNELALFAKAMDGLWEVVEVRADGDRRTTVVYQSLDNPDVQWSHRPYHPETVPPVGTRGRIGFIGLGMKP